MNKNLKTMISKVLVACCVSSVALINPSTVQATTISNTTKNVQAVQSVNQAPNFTAAKDPAAAEVIALIKLIPTKVQLVDELAVITARDAYVALSSGSQKNVDSKSLLKLASAETAITTLTANAQKTLDVIAKIAALTEESGKDDVDAVRLAYNALTPAQKELVSSTKLIKTEIAVAKALGLKTATYVKNEIAALPSKSSVKLTDAPAIQTAFEDYDALLEVQKMAVGSIKKLTEAEAQMPVKFALEIGVYTSGKVTAKYNPITKTITATIGKNKQSTKLIETLTETNEDKAQAILDLINLECLDADKYTKEELQDKLVNIAGNGKPFYELVLGDFYGKEIISYTIHGIEYKLTVAPAPTK